MDIHEQNRRRVKRLIPRPARRKTVARILVRWVDEAVDDQKRLQELFIVAHKLKKFLNGDRKDQYNGVGNEIAIWIGLLIDTHEMGLAYRKNLIASFPDELGVFDDKNEKRNRG